MPSVNLACYAWLGLLHIFSCRIIEAANGNGSGISSSSVGTWAMICTHVQCTSVHYGISPIPFSHSHPYADIYMYTSKVHIMPYKQFSKRCPNGQTTRPKPKSKYINDHFAYGMCCILYTRCNYHFYTQASHTSRRGGGGWCGVALYNAAMQIWYPRYGRMEPEKFKLLMASPTSHSTVRFRKWFLRHNLQAAWHTHSTHSTHMHYMKNSA